MPFRRANRPHWYFQAKTRTGWKQLSTGTGDRRLALKIEAMWHDLAHEERAWDVLAPVLGGQMAVGALFDRYRDVLGRVPDLRRLLNDTDLAPVVQEYLAVQAAKVRPDTLAHLRVHLGALVGDRLLVSEVTPELLTKRLAAYGGGVAAGTQRKLHAEWSGFLSYCVRIKRLLGANPMDLVDRPAPSKPTPRFYELDVVERIVAAQPSLERKAFFALAYGTGIEPSPAVQLTRGDLLPDTREVRAAGTKAHTRDRMVRVAAWAWPYVWAVAEPLDSGARLFPGWNRWTVSDWHRETTRALALTPHYPLYHARHHWAATHLRAGVPVAVVQRQLGHASAKHTLDTYGMFVPSGADRAAADAQVAAYETRRRSAASGANNPDTPSLGDTN